MPGSDGRQPQQTAAAVGIYSAAVCAHAMSLSPMENSMGDFCANCRIEWCAVSYIIDNIKQIDYSIFV